MIVDGSINRNANISVLSIEPSIVIELSIVLRKLSVVLSSEPVTVLSMEPAIAVDQSIVLSLEQNIVYKSIHMPRIVNILI